MYPNYQKSGLLFLSAATYPDPANNIYNQLLVDVDDSRSSKENIDTIKISLERSFDRDDIAVTDRDQNLSYATFDAEGSITPWGSCLP